MAGFRYPIVFPKWYTDMIHNVDDAIIADIKLRNEAYEKLANRHRRENELKKRKHKRK